jgi:hypothetical protein
VAKIRVVHRSGASYRVIVEDAGGATEHDVTVTSEHIRAYAPEATAERLIEASFEFLLEREPKESILRRFELPVIERYFPEFARTIRQRI